MARRTYRHFPTLPLLLGVAAVGGLYYFLRQSTPSPRAGEGIPVAFPNGALGRAKVDDVIAEGNFIEANGTQYRVLQVDRGGRAVRADHGDGQVTTLPFDAITRIVQ